VGFSPADDDTDGKMTRAQQNEEPNCTKDRLWASHIRVSLRYHTFRPDLGLVERRAGITSPKNPFFLRPGSSRLGACIFLTQTGGVCPPLFPCLTKGACARRYRAEVEGPVLPPTVVFTDGASPRLFPEYSQYLIQPEVTETAQFSIFLMRRSG